MKTNIKIIATSLALAGSMGAWAGIGGLSVQSHLGQNFSGSIVVTGDEAEALKSSRSVSVSGSGIRGSVIPQGNGNVVIHLRSSSPIREPIINFTVSAGRQTRQYSAMLNPANYTPQPSPKHVEPVVKEPKTRKPTPESKTERTKTNANTKAGERDFIIRDGKVAAHETPASTPTDTAPQPERKPNTTKETRDNRENKENKTNNTTRNTQHRAAPQNHNNGASAETNVIRKSGKAAVTPRRYRAQAGETLGHIAERHRPRNMSLNTAMRALAMANPAAFKRGNVIQRNTTLYIPTAAQWQAYAQRGQSNSMPATPRRSASRNTMPPMGMDNNASMPEPQTEPQAQQPQPQTQPQAKQPQPQTQPQAKQPQPQTQPQAKQPQPQTQPQAQQPQPQTQPQAQPPQQQPAQTASQAPQPNTAQPAAMKQGASQPTPQSASQPMMQAASGQQAASAQNTAASAMPPAPQPTPQTPPPSADAPADESEGGETNWLMYGLGGLIGVGAIGGAAYALMRRRNTSPSDEGNDDDGEFIEDDEFDDDDGIQIIDDGISLDKSSDSPADRLRNDIARTSASENASSFDDEFEALPDDNDEFETESLGNSGVSLDKDNAFDDFNDFGSAQDTADDSGNDDWSWVNDANKTDDLSSLDELDQLAAMSKADSSDDDWSLDDGTENTFAEKEFSLDDVDDNPFSHFGDEDDFAPAAPKTTSAGAELDDIDAMFANALANLDSLEKEHHSEPKKAKSPAAELDDIDSMFADALANLGSQKTHATEPAAFDDELAAFERPKRTVAADDLGGLDDFDAEFASTLDDLDALADDFAMNQVNQNEMDSLNSLSEFGGLDDDFPEIAHQPAASMNAPSDDIDAMFADALAGLDELAHDAPARQAHALADLDQLNALADFEAVAKVPPAPLDDVDHFFANALSDLDETSSSEPTFKPIVSDEEMESLNSLSELDALENDEPSNNIDAMFADALADLDKLDDELAPSTAVADDDFAALSADTMAFETPVLDSAPAAEETPADDVDSMAFDLSAFDALQAEAPATESLADTASEDDDAMAFDLSGFDLPETETAVETPALDMGEGLAFDTALPETSDEMPLDTPALSDDPDLAFADALASLDDLENADEFSEFSLPEADGLDDIGFVSGAVGSGETLQYKLDLAKMYIDIEDLDSAREQLTELLSEAQGDMLAQVKALLDQIG